MVDGVGAEPRESRAGRASPKWTVYTVSRARARGGSLGRTFVGLPAPTAPLPLPGVDAAAAELGTRKWARVVARVRAEVTTGALHGRPPAATPLREEEAAEEELTAPVVRFEVEQRSWRDE